MDDTTIGFSEDVKMGYRSKTGGGYIELYRGNETYERR